MAQMVATRRFTLKINPLVFNTTPYNSGNIKSHEISKKIYFYTSKSYVIKKTKPDISSVVASHIMNLIVKETQRLIKFWYNNANFYFNRRAFGLKPGQTGRFKPKKGQFQLGKVNTGYIANSRSHTNKLRNSLVIRSINIYGSEMYAGRVHAKTDNRDYIAILMSGAKPSPGKYNPKMDIREKYGTWKGIPNTYWLHWQASFTKQIQISEAKINAQIEAYIEKMKILDKNDIAIIRNTQSNVMNRSLILKEKNLNYNLTETKLKTTSSSNPYQYEDTWEGMKAQYYEEIGQLETLDVNFETNTPKRRNFGRG